MKGRTADLVTGKGRVHIKTQCSPAFLDGMKLDQGIGVFAHYRSIIRSEESFRRIARLEEANLVLAYTDEGQIVGYVAMVSPGPEERWERDGGLLYEVGSIEVSRNWRRRGIARRMLELALEGDWKEEKILYTTGFSWHWDLDGLGLSKIEYRHLFQRLFESLGFRQYYTTEPNINLDPANIFMARIGESVSPEDRARFHDLLFAVDQPQGGEAWSPYQEANF